MDKVTLVRSLACTPTYLIGAALPWLFPAVLIAAGLLVVGGLTYLVFSTRARLRLWEKELASAKERLERQSAALVEAERERARLKRVPKAQILPMLQLAHELRSPLTAVEHALEMILQGYAANDAELLNEMLTLAQSRAAAMLARVNDFLRLGAVQHVEKERGMRPLQMLDVLQRLAPEMRIRARWKAVELRFEVPESLPLLTATDEDIEYLLSNLISNAIKYTNPGGEVTVSLGEKDQCLVGVVEDTGIGIAPEDIPKIFDEFYRAESAKQADAQGTGLGLSIVKRVVDRYGGQLHVESEPGTGSKFTFVFPSSGGPEEEMNSGD